MTGPAYRYAATVEKVVDADTLDVAIDLGFRVQFRVRIRVAGIDAPEMSTAAGKAAAAYVRDHLPIGDPVLLTTYKPDKYGRALADVTMLRYGDDIDLAETLVALGHAVPYDGGAR